jgi:nucleoside-diphosphate-sugar epimerase
MGVFHGSTKVLANVAELDDLLSEPSAATVDALRRLRGDIVVLGVGGKMGPTLARMAKRGSVLAGVDRRVFGVSRFSSPDVSRRLQSWGIETVEADLLSPTSLATLPDAQNVVYMAGMKFGTTGKESLTWAMNAYLPAVVCQRYSGSRIAAFSTGNVYGLSPVRGGGSSEQDQLNPAGEYAMSCVGRERMFEHFSRTLEAPVTLLRLNYATELRYGVLVDIAQRVHEGLDVPLRVGYLNAIWQGDACGMSLQALAHAASPPFVINIAGPELLSVRTVAEEFAARFGEPARFAGVEAEDALLSNARRSHDLFGFPRVTADQLIAWIADWISRGGETLGRPTHFDERAGRF